MWLLLSSLTVAAHELVDTSGGVHELALASVERVRAARDFNFNHWVRLTFEFHGVVALCSGLRKEHIAVGHVTEHDGAIVVGMNSFFHFCVNKLVYRYNRAAKVRTFFHSRKTFAHIFENVKQFAAIFRDLRDCAVIQAAAVLRVDTCWRVSAANMVLPLFPFLLVPVTIRPYW